MKVNFLIEEAKLDDCKKFIRTLKSARFNYNPFKLSGNKYDISLSLDVNDGNKLSIFLESIDTDKKPISKKKPFWKKLFNKE